MLIVAETGKMVLSILKYLLERLLKEVGFFDPLKEGFTFEII